MTGSDEAWVSVSEAARRLGVSRTAIHNRIKRGTLPRMTDNHGHPLVQVAVTGAMTVSPVPCHAITGDTVTPPGPCQPPESVPLSVHREIVATLQQTLDRQERQFRDALEFWRERADGAEVRAEQANAMLADLVTRIMATIPAPAPGGSWWRRWLG